MRHEKTRATRAAAPRKSAPTWEQVLSALADLKALSSASRFLEELQNKGRVETVASAVPPAGLEGTGRPMAVPGYPHVAEARWQVARVLTAVEDWLEVAHPRAAYRSRLARMRRVLEVE